MTCMKVNRELDYTLYIRIAYLQCEFPYLPNAFSTNLLIHEKSYALHRIMLQLSQWNRVELRGQKTQFLSAVLETMGLCSPEINYQVGCDRTLMLNSRNLQSICEVQLCETFPYAQTKHWRGGSYQGHGAASEDGGVRFQCPLHCKDIHHQSTLALHGRRQFSW